MKKAQIIHNPTAGNAAHSKEEIIELIENEGFTTKYVSTDDKDWESFSKNEMNVIFLAGGDGTIRKLASSLIEKKMCDLHIPIYLLPMGTANNIATSIGIFKKLNTASSKKEDEIQKFTCGKLKGINDENFFLEGAGFGVFPELIRQMKDTGKDDETSDEKLKRTLKVLLEIVKNYKAQKANIKADGLKIKGTFLLVELMNIKYIGPNLEFAPNANVGDDFLDLVLIPEEKRKAFVEYVESLINGTSKFQDIGNFIKVLRVQKLKIKWKGSKLHVDDILIEDYDGKKIRMEMNSKTLEFFTNSPVYKEILKDKLEA
ncbi:MAG: diacylglycerol kinase family protein [Salegentibacter sp.]|uniref:diacylglycerol/lipid kinase family protein n=1 Tax=Salegentibacter sp. TaxID=1903072 RepID=UPI0028708A2C|nr:diacylglycerol kinase family protein [Salegentibacter sp.]MDR9457989.1 diacylglycerol kinase family protein [Salegentibacter sp.]